MAKQLSDFHPEQTFRPNVCFQPTAGIAMAAT
jgi:hypothetical protein